MLPQRAYRHRAVKKKKPVIRDESEEEEEAAQAAKRAEDGVAVRAMALAHLDLTEGTDDRRPTNIVGHVDFPVKGRVYTVRYHDPGYDPPTAYEDRPADWCMKWEGLVENYEKVGTAHTSAFSSLTITLSLQFESPMVPPMVKPGLGARFSAG